MDSKLAPSPMTEIWIVEPERQEAPASEGTQGFYYQREALDYAIARAPATITGWKFIKEWTKYEWTMIAA